MLVLTITAFFGDIEDHRKIVREDFASQLPLTPNVIREGFEVSHSVADFINGPSIRCSSSYSSIRTNAIVTFWKLPTSTDSVPLRLFDTTITEDAIDKAILDLQSKGMLKFFLIYKPLNQLKLFNTRELYNYFRDRAEEHENDIYIALETEGWEKWIGKSLQKRTDVWVEESNPWK
jgi:hypothetical protein